MAFFTTKELGRLYVIRIELPDSTTIHKIGMTNSARSVDRMMEILRSWFMRYRFVPMTQLKLDMECQHPRALERYIHKVLQKYRWIPNEKVDGGTEMFTGLNELRVITHLRQFDTTHFEYGLELSDEQYNTIGHLLTP